MESGWRVGLTMEDRIGDGVREYHTEHRWRYEDGLLKTYIELETDHGFGYMASLGIDYTYDDQGREISREEAFDPWLGGIPGITRFFTEYDERGFKVAELERALEWADPDETPAVETHTQYEYLDDGQPTYLRSDIVNFRYPDDGRFHEEVWTYNSGNQVMTHKVEGNNTFFGQDYSQFYTYTYSTGGLLQNIRLQDEDRFGDGRARVIESFSYNPDGSMKEQTFWGTDTAFGFSPWTQVQFTHTSPGYDKTTKLIDLTGDFKVNYKEVTDVWRNPDGQETHTLISRYDATDKLLGRDLFKKGWDGDFLVWETRDYNIHDGFVEYTFESEWLMVA
jgi:hypothetical protein